MTSPPSPESEPPRSVLQELSDRTGNAPKLMLEGSDSVQAGGSPYVDPKGVDRSVLPKGRGNYQILGEIARGGMGTVLKGHDTDLGRDVALKVLEEELAKRPAVLQRFVEEAQIGGQLQHPGIVPVYELGLMADDRPYFTMKLVKGRTLSALLAARRSTGEDRLRFIKIFESVCQTVAYAHSKGVIHRDLKPANVMVGAFGEVQVVDWGLAKVLHRGGVEDEKRAEELSQLTVIETVRSGPGSSGTDSVVGSVMGTPAYMPPEQALGDLAKVDETSDVFSLGAILCETLTGQAPYSLKDGDGDRRRVVSMAAQAELDPARERIAESGADPELVKLCLECLAPSRMARPRNAEDVAERVHQFLSSTEERAQEARIKAVEERRRRRLTVALAGTVVTALLAVGGGYLWMEQQRADRVAEAENLYQEQYSEALAQQEAGLHAEALETAQDALRVVEASAVGGRLLAIAQSFARGLEGRLAEHERRVADEARDASQVQTFEDLRLRTADFSNPRDEIHEGYLQAFADYGLDMESEDLGPALDTMLASDIAEEFAFALDEWAVIKRVRAMQNKADPVEAERLQLLATDLDPHPMRMRMRKAILANDVDVLVELAQSDSLSELPPPTIWVLVRALWWQPKRNEARRLLDQALPLHPDSFLLNFVRGWAYVALDREDIGLQNLAVARSLRPDNAYIQAFYGDAQANLGRWPEALRAYREAARVDPEWQNAQVGIGNSAFHLGLFEEAVAARERELQLEDGGERDLIQAELDAARFCLGELSLDDVRASLFHDEGRQYLTLVAYAMVDHPDPTQRDPEAVLKAARTRLAYQPKHFASLRLAATAHRLLGNYAECLEAADRLDELRIQASRGADAHLGMERAVAYHHMGQEVLARQWFDRADQALDLLRYTYPEDWERAPIVLLRDEAAALLGL